MIKLSCQLAAAIIIIFFAGLTSPTLACTCVRVGPPCQAYWNSPVVFVGTPLSVSRITVESAGHKRLQRLFRFRVEEAFRGVEGAELEVLTGAWGGDCGYDFQTGTKYLVYGYSLPETRQARTSICTRTRPLSEASEDLSYIRSIGKMSPGGLIYGRADQYRIDLENGGANPVGPITGAVVVASSSERRFETVTGSNGKYSFSGIPPGKYTVRVTLPPKLSPIEEETVEVHDRGCAEINYNPVTNGRISGRLLDAQAQPLKSKTVGMLPIGRGGEPLRPLWAFTEEDGSFQFKNLPPGRYLLGVNIAEAPDEKLPYKKTFYPSTPVQSKAEVFLLGEGQHLTGIDFRLPSPLIARTIQGQVVWPDGRPAVKAEVRLEDLESGRSAHWPAKTGTDGRFTFSGFEGVTYKMVATIPADPNWNPDSGNPVALLVSNAVEFTPSAQTKPVRLIINVDGDGIKRTRSTIGPRTTQKSRKKP